MAATQQAPDRIETMELLNTTIEAEEKSVIVENLKEQPLPDKDEKTISPNASRDANAANLLRDAPSQLGSLDAGGNQNAVYPPNIYAPQAHTTLIYRGYDNATGEWEEYPQYVNVEGVEVGSSGAYNENPSLMFHTGYGYNPSISYGPYSPATTPLPNSSGDGQLYSPQHFPFSGPYYQQQATPNMYLSPATSLPQTDLAMPIDQQGAFLAGNTNSNSMLLGPRPAYHLSYDSFGRGSYAGNSGNQGFYDFGQAYDGFGSGGVWSDWSKTPTGTAPLTPLISPVASPQPIGSFGQNIMPFASGMASQQQRSSYGYGSLANSYNRGFSNGGMYYQGSNAGGSISSYGANSRNFFAFDKIRRRGKGNASLCSCNGDLDFLSEQNRGPRANRSKIPNDEQNSSMNNKNERSTTGPDHELYNKPDFVTEYKEAKFFIIKSYSEDNVHKSIKYGVWASTANGNRKLDSAYREAKEKEESCPIFLFFSVNASAQFCGVAEMIGPVDFEKSVDYWQQDKWSGQFPVKWHIVKDVPNNLFRHIILENNDNKPVTNSRDTQEVKLEQGVEMLSILKNHESEMSILDDFDFYEGRQKAMQDRKALQQQQSNSMEAVTATGGFSKQRSPIPAPDNFVNQLQKSFADVVRLEENSSMDPPRVGKVITTPAADNPEDAENSAASTATPSN